VKRILLPKEKPAPNTTQTVYDLKDLPPLISDVALRLDETLKGMPSHFHLGNFDLAQCSRFQYRVLKAESNIPRGYVSTYGRIAKHLGTRGAARAVGNALGSNPFPIVIPCHRTVRSDGSLGGYRGGASMKRRLLEMEGVQFTTSGKLLMNNVFSAFGNDAFYA
jgi:methylated-DNA-[protein]-cysteine S-methyltransferase